MNRQSIFFSITISFIISLALVGVSYFLLIKEMEKKANFKLISKYRSISKILKHENDPQEIKEILNSFGMKRVFNAKIKEKILQNKRLKHHQRKGKSGFLFFTQNGKHYILLKTKLGQVVAKEEATINESKPFVGLIFIGIFIVLILSFLFTIKKLYPLKALQKRVKSIGEENFDAIPALVDKKDEVSMLSNEFAKSSLNLKKIKESRQVFFRNIMHELKTPIAKGNFLLELDDTAHKKERLQDIFNRLNSLINEFASIESIVSKTIKVERGDFFIADIIENVEDMLLLDENALHVNITNQALHVNFKSFSIAIKNLVDNALKYSTNQQAIIYNKNKNIIIENQGKKLPKKLKTYKEPYGNTDKNQGSSGLGLYIVLHLLEANSYTLEYSYIDGKNIFTCKAD